MKLIRQMVVDILETAKRSPRDGYPSREVAAYVDGAAGIPRKCRDRGELGAWFDGFSARCSA